LAQEYTGPVQVLFGVAAAEDPVCAIIRKLLQEFPARDAQLVVCGPLLGANAKVSKLAELERLAKHDLLIISDADVRVPPDFLSNVVAPLLESGGGVSPAAEASRPPAERGPDTHPATSCGLVCCFYRLANPSTPAMQWEAVAINADFWSQVLQSRSLKPMDFALGAVMATRRGQLEEIGGFPALVDCLADDYQLGHRIARRGHRIALCPVVVECWSAPTGWQAVWQHQLRWARTIRVCQPVPYFFSILGNATLWPLLWLLFRPAAPVAAGALVCWLVRILTALDLQGRLNQTPDPGGRASPQAPTSAENRALGDAPPPAPPQTHARAPLRYAWLIPLKDLLQAIIWLLAFLGNRIEWRGERMRLRRDGTLERFSPGG